MIFASGWTRGWRTRPGALETAHGVHLTAQVTAAAARLGPLRAAVEALLAG